MKKFLACILAAAFIVAAGAPLLGGGTVYAGFSMVDDAQTAVEKNMESFLDALAEAEITTSFTQSDLEDMILNACKYSADKTTGAGVLVEKFKITAPTASNPGFMSAIVFIYQDDAEEALEVKKEISTSSGNVTVRTGDEETDEDTNQYTDAEISAMKKSIAAAKKAINDAIWKFDVSNDTTAEDILKMAEDALPQDSDVTVTLADGDFKIIKATTSLPGNIAASLTLSCGSITEGQSIGKTVPMLVTEDSSNLAEDCSAISEAIHNLGYTNRITKEEMLAAARAAIKNGSTAVWKDNFVKQNATFKEQGNIIGYLVVTLNDEQKEIRIHETIPMLVRKIPSDKISVNKEEWEILRITNVERAKVGDMLLSMVAPLQEACDIRETEVLESFSHTRPNGSSCFSAIPSSFQYSGAGENIYKCPAPGIKISGEKAMNAWMNSTGHRENLLKSGYDYIGTGTYDSDKDGSAIQLFAGWRAPITSVTTSAGTMHFKDTDAMQKAYVICTASDGTESYLPLDLDYMTKVDNGYQLNIRCTSPVIFTVGDETNTPDTIKPDDTKPDNTNSFNTNFIDVKADAYYANAVKWAVEKSITTGTTSTTFSPNDTCTRAQIITFLWRAVGSPKATAENPFSDVKESDYFYNAAIWASEKGMVSGSTFSGNTPCTRASTVTYLWKNANSPQTASSGSFADVSADADYAEAVAWAVKEGVTSGTSATEFSPETICSRGQIVTFLNRALQ